MAAGEYVSVSQQADTEKADVEKERQAQLAGPAQRAHEQRELEEIWRARGLSEDVAKIVAQQLTDHDVVRAHARDELGIDIDAHPNAEQAAVASAVRFRVLVLLRRSCLFRGNPLRRYSTHVHHWQHLNKTTGRLFRTLA
jgi:vacuolar iron transporter family protein